MPPAPKLMAIVLALVWPTIAHGQALRAYDCPVTRKMNAEGHEYTAAELARSQFSVRVVETSGGALLQRCSFAPSAGRITCDSYTADHVEVDPHVGVRKYYFFRGQFDLQIFVDGSFIENNGRGDIAFGRCTTQ
jgi:hypothetical protein